MRHALSRRLAPRELAAVSAIALGSTCDTIFFSGWAAAAPGRVPWHLPRMQIVQSRPPEAFQFPRPLPGAMDRMGPTCRRKIRDRRGLTVAKSLGPRKKRRGPDRTGDVLMYQGHGLNTADTKSTGLNRPGSMTCTWWGHADGTERGISSCASA